MKTDTKIRLLFLALAVAGWLAITKNAHGQQAPTAPPPAADTQRITVFVRGVSEDEVGNDIIKGFLANAGDGGDVKLGDPSADDADATVFHIVSNTVDGNPSESTILFTALQHVKGSELLFYIGGLAITTSKEHEADTITGLSQLAAQVLWHVNTTDDFNVTVTPKPQTPAPTKPSAYKRDKNSKS